MIRRVQMIRCTRNINDSDWYTGVDQSEYRKINRRVQMMGKSPVPGGKTITMCCQSFVMRINHHFLIFSKSKTKKSNSRNLCEKMKRTKYVGGLNKKIGNNKRRKKIRNFDQKFKKMLKQMMKQHLFRRDDDRWCILSLSCTVTMRIRWVLSWKMGSKIVLKWRNYPYWSVVNLFSKYCKQYHPKIYRRRSSEMVKLNELFFIKIKSVLIHICVFHTLFYWIIIILLTNNSGSGTVHER